MKAEKKHLMVLFHHGDFSPTSRKHLYFGAQGPIHLSLEKASKRKLCWKFIGGFIHNNRQDFWKAVKKADVLFTRTQNMDYNDIDMHWHHAEESMFVVLHKIKQANPKIKIFFFGETPERIEQFETLGTFISDLHGDEEVVNFLQQ